MVAGICAEVDGPETPDVAENNVQEEVGPPEQGPPGQDGLRGLIPGALGGRLLHVEAFAALGDPRLQVSNLEIVQGLEVGLDLLSFLEQQVDLVLEPGAYLVACPQLLAELPVLCGDLGAVCPGVLVPGEHRVQADAPVDVCPVAVGLPAEIGRQPDDAEPEKV